MKPDINNILETALQAYPELRSKDVRVQWAKLEDAVMEVQPLSPEGWIIEVDKSLQDASNEVILGGLAHELAHIIRDTKETWIDKILYKISVRYQTNDERNTDLEAVFRGFAPQLLAFMQATEKLDYEYYEEDGLSTRELKLLIKIQTPKKQHESHQPKRHPRSHRPSPRASQPPQECWKPNHKPRKS